MHVIKNFKELGVDIEKLVLAGDSAGGNKKDKILLFTPVLQFLADI